MNKKTILALKGSIEKWKKIVDFLRYKQKNTPVFNFNIDKLQQGESNCPLCQAFPDEVCSGCPVKIRTGRRACLGTPYYDFLSFGTPADMRKVAKAELEFLESLREV